ncbi:MAG TPA: sensor histidine kinase, partial [Ktedonobacteraceae bacterium]|nr:sensor histidine kinase [Ktedonobacteraceae bacterium]
WIGMVFLWGCAQLLLGNGGPQLLVGDFFVYLRIADPHPPFSKPHPVPQAQGHFLAPFLQIPFPLKLICVALLMVQCGLHWLCLSGKVRRRWSWGYFLLQGISALLISFIWADPSIALGLYLLLIIEALSLLKQVRQIVIVAGSALGLFLVTITWQVTQRFWITGESVLLLIIFLLGWIMLSIQQVHARSELEAAHLELAAYAMRVEELTLLNERERLARELHDTLAQDLVGLKLQLERVDLHLEKRRVERARELVQQAMSRASATLAEARHAIDDLRAHTPGPQSLLLAVQREMNHFRATASLTCAADLSALATVPEEMCEHVLRAITEGLTNVARHAQAHQVWVCVQRHEALLTIEVRDDGIGFDSAEVVLQEGHYGLLGVRERARLCGGRLDIESAVGEGTVLRLHLPVRQRGELVSEMEPRQKAGSQSSFPVKQRRDLA